MSMFHQIRAELFNNDKLAAFITEFNKAVLIIGKLRSKPIGEDLVSLIQEVTNVITSYSTINWNHEENENVKLILVPILDELALTCFNKIRSFVAISVLNELDEETRRIIDETTSDNSSGSIKKYLTMIQLACNLLAREH